MERCNRTACCIPDSVELAVRSIPVPFPSPPLFNLSLVQATGGTGTELIQWDLILIWSRFVKVRKVDGLACSFGCLLSHIAEIVIYLTFSPPFGTMFLFPVTQPSLCAAFNCDMEHSVFAPCREVFQMCMHREHVPATINGPSERRDDFAVIAHSCNGIVCAFVRRAQGTPCLSDRGA